MRNSWRWGFVIASLAAFVAGCPKKNDAASDAAPEGSASAVAVVDAAPPPPALPKAVNENDIARFGDETALNGDAAKIASTVLARRTPPNGATVATLKPGTDVQKIAQRDKFFLVTFTKPGGSDVMMGWVAEAGFAAAAVATAGQCKTDAECKKPTACLTVGKALRCEQPCAEDKDCTGGKVCEGEALGPNGGFVKYCFAKVVSDAGAAPVATDAGAPPPPTPTEDASAPPAPTGDAGPRRWNKPTRF